MVHGTHPCFHLWPVYVAHTKTHTCHFTATRHWKVKILFVFFSDVLQIDLLVFTDFIQNIVTNRVCLLLIIDFCIIILMLSTVTILCGYPFPYQPWKTLIQHYIPNPFNVTISLNNKCWNFRWTTKKQTHWLQFLVSAFDRINETRRASYSVSTNQNSFIIRTTFMKRIGLISSDQQQSEIQRNNNSRKNVIFSFWQSLSVR